MTDIVYYVRWRNLVQGTARPTGPTNYTEFYEFLRQADPIIAEPEPNTAFYNVEVGERWAIDEHQYIIVENLGDGRYRLLPVVRGDGVQDVSYHTMVSRYSRWSRVNWRLSIGRTSIIKMRDNRRVETYGFARKDEINESASSDIDAATEEESEDDIELKF